MKIRLSKRKGSISLRFEAQDDQEGVDLKDIVLAMGKGGDMLQELKQRGYEGTLTKETSRSREFVVRKGGAV